MDQAVIPNNMIAKADSIDLNIAAPSVADSGSRSLATE
jgi:hypothetical protein